MPIKATTTTKRGKRKKKKIQKNLQNKSKHKNNKCFSWVTAVRVLSLIGSHSPPYLPRMPSNTVLISGHAVGQLTFSYGLTSMCSCLWCPQLSELVHFILQELLMTFYIFHQRSLSSWSCGFNLQLLQLVGRFWVLFLSHAAPGFQLWFYFYLYMWVIGWGLAPEAALEDLSLPLWGPGVEVVQLLGLQGFWQHQVLRGVGSYGSRK